jgi:small GTP-binding protein
MMAEPDFKLAVAGGAGVGKSALTFQLINNHFVEGHDPTIEDSYRKQFKIDQETCLLEILNTGGEDEFTGASTTGMKWYMIPREYPGLLCVFSITDRGSFDEISTFCERLRARDDLARLPMVLVGNKCDLEHLRVVPTSEGADLAKSFGCQYLEASAKSCINVEACFFELVREMHKATPKKNPHDEGSSKDKQTCSLS